jgi:hypothetical protein
MARRRRRYKHRSKKYWSGYHRSSHNKLHAAYGGLEYDIQSIFFRLDEHTLNLTLRDYEKRYGYGAREYAARTFTKWRSGQVGMSGTVLQRFIHLVPPHLSFKLKFDLLVKAASQNKNSIKVYVPVISTLETSDYEFSQTHRSEQGDARITVSRKTESKKFCFVATACFDDIDHPIVSRLRRLRDERLAKYVWGQKFINWYYRNGEELADSISKIPGARTALKPILWFIAYTFTLTSRD